MAITKLQRKTNPFQVKVKGPDGKWITKVFSLLKEAEEFEGKLRSQKRTGTLIPNADRQLTVNEYFETWMETAQHNASPGWRAIQKQLFRDYVKPLIGECKLQTVSPPTISQLLSEMAKKGKSEQTRLHTFNLLRKMFLDGVELFQVLNYNPVLRKLKPRVPLKETRYLNMEQVKLLLSHVADKPYGVAIWLQLYLGLRVGEVQALRWSDVDLVTGQVFIQRAFSRKDTWATKQMVIKNYPKGGKHHTLVLPPELWGFLKEKKKEANSTYIAPSPTGNLIGYERYRRCLIGYCKELDLPVIGTHGLRHSTSAVYLSHGASKDDLRMLFAHSCPSLTERYTHGVGTNLQRISNVIRLFGDKVSTKVSTLDGFEGDEKKVSTKFPHSGNLESCKARVGKISNENC